MPSTAAETALSTPELLEAILLELDMATLLVSAQRVDRYWFGLISASIRLQQALYFKPVPSYSKPPSAYITKDDRWLKNGPWMKDNPWFLDWFHSRESQNELMAFLNPLLFKHFGSLFFDISCWSKFCKPYQFAMDMPWWADDHGSSQSCDELNLPVELLPRQKAFTRSGASWRRMLVSQPAPLALGYVWYESSDHNEVVSKGIMDENPSQSTPLPMSQTGLYMGLLYDMIQHYAGRGEYDRALFRVVWGHPWQHRTLVIQQDVDRTSNELLEEVGIIVQFVRFQADYMPRKPLDVVAWDSAFRSEDFKLPEYKPVEVFRGAITGG
ncbi:hypothetical protein P170DRAFT_435112 [Aspergillus steynii IBT 23096]|uniref:F-box domain-containing protein n=1 Tax=Aspergillus steynii IBT 23096 TaxID=1392250 RepID=A0A2I2GKT0_9EURO|nr:uncharacterized protein P170DRAFT_435112 [Aspergillus steynii IBT 23096]PLB53484.1 hypothetical protein P170DRAFT_435112 [Aspergillus steynii IBT 23096]